MQGQVLLGLNTWFTAAADSTVTAAVATRTRALRIKTASTRA
jgi:hypothetical protein